MGGRVSPKSAAKIENINKLSKLKKNMKESTINALNSDLSDLQRGAKKAYNSKYSIKKMQRGYLELFNTL